MAQRVLILDREKTIEQMFRVCQYYDFKNIDLANLLDTSEVEVCNWKTGKRFPTWDKIMFFATVFNIPLEEFIVKKEVDTDTVLEEIREKIKTVNKKNLIKTLKRKFNTNENLISAGYHNVRWNPLVQDWVPLEKYQEITETTLSNHHDIERIPNHHDIEGIPNHHEVEQ